MRDFHAQKIGEPPIKGDCRRGSGFHRQPAAARDFGDTLEGRDKRDPPDEETYPLDPSGDTTIPKTAAPAGARGIRKISPSLENCQN